MTTLYLVRHGETIDNASQILQGHLSGELNDKGIAQARRAAQALQAVNLDAIVSSDLKRAIDTAQIIAAPRAMRVTTTPLLRERDWGDFTGRFIPDLKDLPFPANTETMEQILKRARKFLTWLRQQYPGKTVLAVGHGIINKAIISVYSGAPMKEIPKMGNGEYRILPL